MYIDPKDPTRRMEQEVNDATAKLKGLLGIGSISAAPAAAAESSPPTSASEDPAQSSVTKAGAKQVTRSKRRKNYRKDKKLNEEEEQRQQQQQQLPLPQGEALGKKQGKSPPKNLPEQLHDPAKGGGEGVPPVNPKKGKGKKNKNIKRDNVGNTSSNNNAAQEGNAGNNKGGNKGPNANANFAWSAFQSSPDASKLPIPAFSPANTRDMAAINDAEVEQQMLASLLPVTAGETTTTTADAPPVGMVSAESVENQAIAAAKEAAAAHGGMLQEENDASDVAGLESKDAVGDQEPGLEEAEASSSMTGVNLAALTSKPTADGAVNAVSGGSTGAPGSEQQHPTYNMTDNLPPQQHPMIYPYNPYGGMMHHHQYPHPHHHPQYPPPPPPGYMTIQVQVPPALMPGRQMVVQSPAGYPVRVVVPEGIPPGMIIPVHVPAGPPMHMMPPQGATSHYGAGQQQQPQNQQQRYYQNQPGR